MTSTAKPQETVQLGQIFYSSYGYGMTIVGFYVVDRFTAKSVWLRPIGRIVKNDNGMGNGTAEPDTNRQAPDERVFRKSIRYDDDGTIYLPDNISAYGIWDGKPMYFNTYD